MSVQATSPKEKTKDSPSHFKGEKFDKRQAIIEAAKELFTNEGYETTTIAQVARKAGVAVGTVYLYFKNKNELLYGVKGDWEMQMLQGMSRPELQDVPHHQRGRALISAAFEVCTHQMENVQLMGLQPQGVGKLGDNGHGEGLLMQRAIQAFLEDGIAAGVFRPLDTEVVAQLAFGMVHTALHQCFDLNGGKNQERYIDALVDATENWFIKPELLKSKNK